MTWLSESPTSTTSTPDSSTSRPNSASYAVTATIVFRSRFMASSAAVVTAFWSGAWEWDIESFELAPPPVAVGQLGMGNGEVALLDRARAVENDVAIER